jgi:hypothetical protein
MEIEVLPLKTQIDLYRIVRKAMLTKAATKSPEEVAKLHKEFDRGLKPRLIPDGIVAFLLQNSPLAEVNIITDYLPDFNIKQVVI